ncbi:hypothetical protein PIB30_029719 [Stylosanthes scabra]|uniref:Uncharacterized protein n=1 Tax=Stylosanthes scabra TaxID=79078 RepID=A0ABU6XA76_9FABA|nr:hypothetical protein [Stylosanthes scabra]
MNASEGRSRQQRVSQELATTLKIPSTGLRSFSQRVNAWADLDCQGNGGCNCVCVGKESKREVREKTDKKVLGHGSRLTLSGETLASTEDANQRINSRVTHEATLYQSVEWVDQHRSISPRILIFQSNGPRCLEHG